MSWTTTSRQTLTAMVLAASIFVPAASRAQDRSAKSGPPMELTALDYIQIQQLVAKYAQYIDTCSNNGYDYADLFAADGFFAPFQNGEIGRKAQGREALAKVSGGGPDGCTGAGWIRQGVHHMYVNHIINPAPGGATGQVNMLMIGLGGDKNKIEHDGYYEDTYVKTPQGWRFASAVHHATYNPGQGGEPATRCRAATPAPSRRRGVEKLPLVTRIIVAGRSPPHLTVASQGWCHSHRTARPVSSVSSLPEEFRPVLTKYCVTCHSERLKTAGFSLEAALAGGVADHAELWEKVIVKLRSGTMPPAGRPRPDSSSYDAIAASLESTLNQAEAAHPNPGGPLLHRMNRAEYANAIRDLLALDVDPATLLPPDDSSSGFDNVADVLGVSPALMERYLSAAGEISALAVGGPSILPSSRTYHVTPTPRRPITSKAFRSARAAGCSRARRCRSTVSLIKVKLLQTNLGSVRGLEYPQQLEIAVDGARVHLVPMGGPADFAILPENAEEIEEALDARLRLRLPIAAGPHTIVATFVQKTGAAGGNRLQPFLRSNVDATDHTGLPHVESMTIEGPFGATASGDTPSRRAVFTCRPSSHVSEKPCATTIISSLAHRAYRRPVTNVETSRLLALYDQGRVDGTFDSGVEFALRGILASAKFVFRGERDPDNLAPGRCTHRRPRARLAVVVLLMELDSRR